MIRVTFLAHSLRLGGTEVQLTTLARGLDRKEFAPALVSFHHDGVLLDEVRAAGIPVTTVGKRGRADMVGFVARIAGAVRATRPDAVYSFLDFPNVVGAVAKSIGATRRLVWGMRASDMRLHERGLSWRINFTLERWLARRADLIICNSWAGFHHLENSGFPTGRMQVVPNGFDTERFAPDPAVRHRARQQLGLREDDFAIGLVARFDPIKDHETFLRAAGRLAQENEHARFVCVGDGPAAYGDHLRALASQFGIADRVIWAGARSDVNSMYNAFDVASLTSISEGFPNVVGEAMCAACPCVVTDAGDAARMVADTGRAVPVGAADELAAAWAELAALPRDKIRALGEAARDRALQEFPRAAMIERTAAHLRHVVGADRRCRSRPAVAGAPTE